jgi:hypothetical protein
MNLRKATLICIATALGFSHANSESIRREGVYGSFSFYPYQDPISDEPRDFASTFEKDDKSGDVQVSWECEEDGLNVSIRTGQYFSSSEKAKVIYRLDKQDAVTSDNWEASNEGVAVYMPAELVSSFTKKALRSNQLVTRTYDDDGTYKTYTFMLNGLDEALNHLRCIN